MTTTFTPDSNDTGCVGLDKLVPGRVIRVIGTMNVGNPYAAGGVAFSAANLKTALDTAYGSYVPTLVIDQVEFLGKSSDGTVEMRWDGGNSKVMAFGIGTAASLTAGVQASLAGGVAPTLVHSTQDLVPVAHVGTLAAPVVGGVTVTLQNAGGYITPIILPAGVAPGAAGECAYAQAAGTFTCLAADAITHIHVHCQTYTAGSNAVLTQNTLQALTANTLPSEYGAVDLSAAAKTCACAVSFHLA